VKKPARQHRGVTLLELIVVISIIVILVGLAVPALRGARDRGRKTTELNDLRQIGFAWTMYANLNNEAALPGYLEPRVQQQWEVRYHYHKPSGDDNGLPVVPPAPDFEPHADNTAGPWPWRAMPRMNYDTAGLRGYMDQPVLDAQAIVGEAHRIAEEPAFGYNGYYFGGWWSMTNMGALTRPYARMSESRDLETNARIRTLQSSVSSVARPSEVIVFVSTTRVDAETYRAEAMPDDARGWHMAVPPFLAEQPMWDANQLSITAHVRTPVPIGRYTGQAAIVFADLNTNALDPTSLRDQRMWIGPATSTDWKHREIFPGQQ